MKINHLDHMLIEMFGCASSHCPLFLKKKIILEYTLGFDPW